MEETPTVDRPYLSLVIPAYRQAKTICRELTALDRLLATLVPSHELILVIDGNEDDTLSAVTNGCHLPHLRVECFEDNQGKGAAVRHGLLHARGELAAFLDAGGDVNPTVLRILLAEQDLHNADIVIGSKRHSLSEVSYPPLRRLYSSVYQLLNRVLFRLRIRDTQVGVKLFRREVLQTVLPRILVKAFAFDLELLVVSHHLGFRRIVEVPVRLRYGFTSTISFRAVWKTLWDTLAVFYRLRLLHWYDRPYEVHAPAASEMGSRKAPQDLRAPVPASSPRQAAELP